MGPGRRGPSEWEVEWCLTLGGAHRYQDTSRPALAGMQPFQFLAGVETMARRVGPLAAAARCEGQHPCHVHCVSEQPFTARVRASRSFPDAGQPYQRWMVADKPSDIRPISEHVDIKLPHPSLLSFGRPTLAFAGAQTASELEFKHATGSHRDRQAAYYYLLY